MFEKLSLYGQKKLESDLEKLERRFLKIVKTNYNESTSLHFWERMAGNKKDAIKARDASFECNKLNHCHNHLRLLIDLFDYKDDS